MNPDQTELQHELKKFLAKVDNVESIVKGFTSKDQEVQADSIYRADKLIGENEKTGFGKTVINKSRYKNEESSLELDKICNQPSISQESFLDALEVDAKRRAANRKERMQKANILKEKANAAFKDENYEIALEKYNQAIDIAKDMHSLYTNRALTNIKLERFDDAVKDSDMALRIEPKWIKGYITKGNALKHLQKYDEAVTIYKEILSIDKTEEKMVKDYVSKALEAKQVHELEVAARLSLEEKTPAAEQIALMIRTITTRGMIRHESKENMCEYYATSFRLLAALIEETGEMGQTVFRTAGGFKILESQPHLQDILLQRNSTAGSQLDLVTGVLVVLQQACLKCSENMRAMLEVQMWREILICQLGSRNREVKQVAIICFYDLSIDVKSVGFMCDQFKPVEIVTNLLSMDILTLKLLDKAMAVMMRCCESKKFLHGCAEVFNSVVLQLFHRFIDDIGHNQQKELPQCMECLIKFSVIKSCYQMMATDEKFWESLLTLQEHLVHIMEQSIYRDELLLKTLGLMEVLFVHKMVNCDELSPRTGRNLLLLLSSKNLELVEKCLTVLSKMMGKAKETTVTVFQSSGGLVAVKKVYKFIKHEMPGIRTYSLKTLCFIAQVDVNLLKNISKFDKKYSVIRHALNLEENEIDLVNQGHAALLLGFMSVIPGAMDPVADFTDDSSNLVMHLLKLMRNSRNTNARYNCTIALGKMARNDDRILGEVRRLDGINILSKHKPPVEDLQ